MDKEKFNLITSENRREIRAYADIVVLQNDSGNAARKLVLPGIPNGFALFGNPGAQPELTGLYIDYFGTNIRQSGLLYDESIKTLEEAEARVNRFIEEFTGEIVLKQFIEDSEEIKITLYYNLVTNQYRVDESLHGYDGIFDKHRAADEKFKEFVIDHLNYEIHYADE